MESGDWLHCVSLRCARAAINPREERSRCGWWVSRVGESSYGACDVVVRSQSADERQMNVRHDNGGVRLLLFYCWLAVWGNGELGCCWC